MKDLAEPIIVIFSALVTVALLSVILSTKSNTTGVLQALFSGFGNALGVATAPVTGATVTPNLSYPSNTGFGMMGGSNFGLPSGF